MWSTTRFITPNCLASLKFDWNHSPRPVCWTIFHDSSATLISRSRPGRSAIRASNALIHAVAQAIRMPTAGESLTACRSSTSSRASRSRPGVVGPSNIPRKGPSHRSWIASAARRASSASRSQVVRSRSAMSATGSNRTLAICGSVGSATPLSLIVCSASRSAAASIWLSGPPTAVIVTARSNSSWACSSGREASGLSRIPPPGSSATGVTPTAAHSGPYSRLTSSTSARRPNSSIRHSSVFTSALLPCPSLPRTIAFGSSRVPSPYRTQGS